MFFNGAKAKNEYFKRVQPRLSDETKGIKYFTLPSTSPAMAQLTLNEKLIEWSKIKRIAELYVT